MLLKLSEKATFWFHGDIHFSYDDPGPKEIDLESLDPETNDIIERSVKSGNLKIVDETQKDLDVSTVIQEEPKVHDPQLDQLTQRANTVLKGSAKTVTAFCKKKQNQSYKLLSLMLKFEKDRQKRKTVISLIEKTLDGLGGVSTIVEDNTDEHKITISLG